MKAYSILATAVFMGAGLAAADSFTSQVESVLIKGGSSGQPNEIQVNLVSPNWIHPIISASDPSKNQLLSTLLTAKSNGTTIVINTVDNGSNPNYPIIKEIQY
jgi:hypothetical protein